LLLDESGCALSEVALRVFMCLLYLLLQGVRGMRVGGQRRVLVPPELVRRRQYCIINTYFWLLQGMQRIVLATASNAAHVQLWLQS
jgi:hypothetical protein